ncbi:MAG TPA: RNA-binding protein [Chitinophagaceae bacterium]|nr:RNA-binding protein [Chitinophagaceae bacterium]
MNIFVSNLSFTATDESLRQLFAGVGTVSSAKIIMDKYTNRSKGFGFVEMPDKSDAENAIKQLNGSHFEGRAIVVNEARPREEKPGGRQSYSKSRW